MTILRPTPNDPAKQRMHNKLLVSDVRLPRPVQMLEPSPGTINSRMGASTGVILLGALAAVGAASGATEVNGVFSMASSVFGVAVALAFAIESTCGVRNLVRVDLFAIATLYLLTFLEFLFPQEPIIHIPIENSIAAVEAVLVSFAGIAIGRHAFPLQRGVASFARISVSPSFTIGLMVILALLGHLFMLLAVNFDVIYMFNQIQQPRFSQPWSRGRFGSWSTLLNELEALTFILPALAGSVFARSRGYSAIQKLVALLIFAFVLFEGLASGTRTIFMTYIGTFCAAFALTTPRLTLSKALALVIPVFVVIGLANTAMLTIRTVGLSGYIAGVSSSEESIFVDLNIVNIAQITEHIPRDAPYLGLEVPVNFLIRPIPRAIWPGKPEGLSFSINDAVGASDNLTISASFPGELWMSGGFLAIALGSLIAGAAAARWNQFGASAQSTIALITYATGFFPAGLMMRSLMSSAPAFLPVLALLVYMSSQGGPSRRKT